MCAALLPCSARLHYVLNQEMMIQEQETINMNFIKTICYITQLVLEERTMPIGVLITKYQGMI